MTKQRWLYVSMGVVLGVLVAIGVVKTLPDSHISAISRDGVVSQIQKTARLQTIAFSIDTVITAQKQGTWQKLWQDEQKGLFVAKGRVQAGVDLSKISTEMVQVSQLTKDDKPITQVVITLPPSEVFEVFLDDLQLYDWQTGLFGVVDNDPKLLEQVQLSAKEEVLNKACQGDIMNLATASAKEQVGAMFALVADEVVVNTQGAGACRLVK